MLSKLSRPTLVASLWLCKYLKIQQNIVEQNITSVVASLWLAGPARQWLSQETSSWLGGQGPGSGDGRKVQPVKRLWYEANLENAKTFLK